ncbi:calmodulin-regulated spectrin-associated protein 1 [Bombina bombina]|uniref:calmodulin-regulated spectrin-associated protein 1 n=1 Tax=Bombina bombina TaxID=8345 RepID=UPI00235ABE3F|nr:calmodulin-regulated spectrin-associated protein 1 [Bombina bombina]XP_053551714.1 calmodulin-regulated spectrin-associated protein 1 [Bombina bombina]
MVDVGVCASGDSIRRKMDSYTDCAVEVVPLELYDSFRAKIAANLQWICAKAYGIENVPEELKDPFYIDQYEQEHIKPPVIKLLLSSELYCRVCSLILKGDQVAALQGHQPVIQALSRKGIYVMESEDAPVSESDLCCSPIKMSAHMSMIDALMMAYTVEMISIEKVVASVKRFSTFSASKELPYDLEDAMVFWINKLNLKMREILEKEQRLKQQIIESPSHQKVRYRRDHPSNRQLPYFPLLEDLMKDISDGAALLTVIHFYCPEQMKLDDICLKEVTSIADSIYNIQLLKEFANEYLNKCFYLTLEDMLYSPLVLKPNIMVFIAELFWWFENVKPDFVQPRDAQEIKEVKSVAQNKSGRPTIPISNATKRSFMTSPASTPDPQSLTQASSDSSGKTFLQAEELDNGKGSTAFSPSHPLLPLRQKQQKTQQSEESPNHRDRSNSLTRSDAPPRASIIAWPEKKQRPLSQPTPFALHCATDDVDAASGDSISLARSISKDSLASNIINATPKHQAHPTPVKPALRSLLGNVEIEGDEEELVAFIKLDETSSQGDLELQSISSRASSQMNTPRSTRKPADGIDGKPESFFLEPLMPAVLKPAKEKQIIPKREEYGEGKQRGLVSKRQKEGNLSFSRKKVNGNHMGHELNRTFTPVSSTDFATSTDPVRPDKLSLVTGGETFRPLATSSVVQSSDQASSGFFLHDSETDDIVEDHPCMEPVNVEDPCDPDSTWTVIKDDSDSDNLSLEECEQEPPPPPPPSHTVCKYIGEEESAKLQEDMKVKEHNDKDDASGRSSPCLSTISQVSSISMASGSVRMTSFAERKFQRLNSYETKSSTSSSQKTTPDGSECCTPPLTTWRQKREQSPGRQNKDHGNILASELVQLHMQLEEKRRAIEAQKKKMESLSARQRLKLGKAAFLHVVKKGKPEGMSQPIRPEHCTKEYPKQNSDELNTSTVKDKAGHYLEKLETVSKPFDASKEEKIQETVAFVDQQNQKDLEGTDLCNMVANINPELVEVDVNECDLSIEKLNETISTLQQAILKISQQQELLMKSPSVVIPTLKNNSQDHKVKSSVHYVEPLSPTGVGAGRKPPRFGQGRNHRSLRLSEQKASKEKPQNSSRVITPTQNVDTLPHLKPPQTLKSPCTTSEEGFFDNGSEQGSAYLDKLSPGDFRLHDEPDHRTFVLSTSKDANIISEQMHKEALNNLRITGVTPSESSGKENVPVDEPLKGKSSLIEVDLSELKEPDEPDGLDHPEKSTDIISDDQKSGLGFFFKDEQKAEDELAKKRAAFLLKQQRKAEEARIRKQVLEAEIEQKRDEARRKAEEDRVRKDEEKARRELIKQEYLRRKQEQILEEQGLGRPKPKARPKKPRPKSVHREECHSDSGTKYSSTPDNLSSAQSGSSLSLASGATTEAESVHSGGTPSHRADSVETLSVMSRHQSRNAERDWENASTASSIASVAEYSGPKLYKEPSSKSNKPIIHNAISHCCLAGKVNEGLKNSTLEELEKCDSNHYIILFRDAGCQFRALYSFYPDTEEICKLTGTGPKNITKKMIDKLYKYSSDRKQFTVIPAKTMSASVDAVTIHNHLWQTKRPALPKKSPLYK